MAQRKYSYYVLVTDYWVDEIFEKYADAFSEYQKQVRYGHSATLFGVTEEGEISVIFSHD